MTEFTLFHHISGEDIQVQFFYSLDTSTPCCTVLMQPNPHRFHYTDTRLTGFESVSHKWGPDAIEAAREHLDRVGGLT